MGKTKSAKPDQAIKSSKDAQVKSLSSVKHGAVTKPSQTPKAKSKEMAKQVAAKADVGKKSKKAVKEPTPESDDSIVSSEEEDESSASSASSDDESDEEPAPKVNGTKTNGVAKASSSGESESSDSSESSDEEDAKPVVAPQVTAGKQESDSEDDSEDESSEAEEEEPMLEKVNGKLEKAVAKTVSDELPSASCNSNLCSQPLTTPNPTRNLLLLKKIRLKNLLMKAKRKPRHLRSARLRKWPHRLQRRQRPIPHWVTRRRGISSSANSPGTSMKNGSRASLSHTAS